MKALVFLCALTLGIVGSATAQAQGFGIGVYVGPSPAYDDYYDYSYAGNYGRGRRVYGYVPSYDVDHYAERPNRPGGCGTFFYWDGEACVDARNR